MNSQIAELYGVNALRLVSVRLRSTDHEGVEFHVIDSLISVGVCGFVVIARVCAGCVCVCDC